MDFKDIPIYDLGTVAAYSGALHRMLRDWKVLESIPLEHWKSFAGENPSREMLERRKEIDRKKFREPAKEALRELNRGLASLGLGQLTIDSFIEKES